MEDTFIALSFGVVMITLIIIFIDWFFCTSNNTIIQKCKTEQVLVVGKEVIQCNVLDKSTLKK